MPSNALIPLMAKVAGSSPATDVLKTVTLLRKQADEYDKAQRDEEDQRALATSLQAHRRADGTVDFNKLSATMAAKNPQRAATLMKTIQDLQHKQAQTQTEQMDYDAKRAARFAHLLNDVKTAEDYAIVYPQLQRIDPDAATELGPTFNARRIGLAVNAGHTFGELNTVQQQAQRLALSGDVEAALERYAQGIKDQGGWDHLLQFGRGWGLSDAQIEALGPTFDGDASLTRLKAISQTPAERQQEKYRDTAEGRAVEDQANQNRNAADLLRVRNARLGLSTAAAARTAGGAGGKDDPTLPEGVQAYLAKLRQKYPGNFAGAEAELKVAMPDLIAQHPRLGAPKVWARLNAQFGKATAASPETKLSEQQQAAADAIAARIVAHDNAAGAPPPPPGAPVPPGAPPFAAPQAPLSGVTAPAAGANWDIPGASIGVPPQAPLVPPTAPPSTAAQEVGRRSSTHYQQDVHLPLSGAGAARALPKIGSIQTLKDGRRIIVNAVDAKSGKVTDYDFIGSDVETEDDPGLVADDEATD